MSDSPIDHVLWRIVDAGSRYSDRSSLHQRRQVWEALEAAVAEATALFAAVQAEAAEARAATVEAEQRVEAANRQRTRERKRLSSLEGSVEAASQIAEALRARCEEAIAERDAAVAAREEAETAAARAEARRSKAEGRRSEAERARDLAVAGVEETKLAVQEARSALAAAQNELASTRSALAEARGERDAALARARAAERTQVEAAPEIVLPDEVVLDDPAPRGENGAVVRYLHVGATMGHLLPKDLVAALIPEARIVRQEGRLAALIALPCGPGGTPTARGQEQARRLEADGFRIEWLTEIDIAS